MRNNHGSQEDCWQTLVEELRTKLGTRRKRKAGGGEEREMG